MSAPPTLSLPPDSLYLPVLWLASHALRGHSDGGGPGRPPESRRARQDPRRHLRADAPGGRREDARAGRGEGGDVVYDLGCGDGRIPATAAKKYGVKAVGFDVDPQRIKESNENVRKNGVGKLVTIKQEDIFKHDLSKVNVVTLYLLPSLNVKLMPQLDSSSRARGSSHAST